MHTCCPTSKTHQASHLQARAHGICPGCQIQFCIKLMFSMQSACCCIMFHITCSVKPAQTCPACRHQCNHLLNILALMAAFYRAANGSGGGVYLAANGATLSNITDTEFNSNTAGADGGALNVTGGATVLTLNTFVANSAAGMGGAVAYSKECFVAGKRGVVVLSIFMPEALPHHATRPCDCISWRSKHSTACKAQHVTACHSTS